VGHGAVIHGAHVGRNVLIGIQAVLMDNAVIGEDAVIGAMAYVPEGMVVPPKSLVVGVPARIVRTLAEKDLGWKRGGTLEYQELTRRCLATLRPVQPLTAPQENRPRYEGRISKTLSEVRGKTAGG
jgi:phenylacetic acid degradation protein